MVWGASLRTSPVLSDPSFYTFSKGLRRSEPLGATMSRNRAEPQSGPLCNSRLQGGTWRSPRESAEAFPPSSVLEMSCVWLLWAPQSPPGTQPTHTPDCGQQVSGLWGGRGRAADESQPQTLESQRGPGGGGRGEPSPSSPFRTALDLEHAGPTPSRKLEAGRL